MTRLKQTLSGVGAVALVAVIGSLIDSRHVAAQSPPETVGAPVRIQSPLPLPVTGSVGITGTPTFNIVSPLAVKNLVRPYNQTRVFGSETVPECFFLPGSSILGCRITFPTTVPPAGQVLVLTRISGKITIPVGQNLRWLYVNSGDALPDANPILTRHYVAPQRQYTEGLGDVYVVNSEILAYCRIGFSVEFSAGYPPGSAAFAQYLTVSGYYADSTSP